MKAFVEFVSEGGLRLVIRRSCIVEICEAGFLDGQRLTRIKVLSGNGLHVRGELDEVLQKIGWCPTCVAGPNGCSNDEGGQ